jgi:hypothetical protein
MVGRLLHTPIISITGLEVESLVQRGFRDKNRSLLVLIIQVLTQVSTPNLPYSLAS